MKKLLFALALMGCTPAAAGVPCSLPFNLQNGQPADATQVMANYNAIIVCLTNAAAAGNNSDITVLTGLVTPVTPAQGGTQTFVATAPATGSANAIVVSATNPPGFVLTAGFSVVFIASATNTDATTLQVGSTPATAVSRRTTDGVLPTVGGEIITNALTVATYDGAVFQLLGVQAPIGTVLDTMYASPDPGWALVNGQCLPASGKYASLVSKAGLGPGACGAGNFQMPDARGRVIAMVESGGSANLTLCTGHTILGTQCGAQQETISTVHLPNVVFTTNIAAGQGSHTHTSNAQLNSQNEFFAGGGFGTTSPAGATIDAATLPAMTGTTQLNTGAQLALPTVQPALILNKQVKY